MALRDLFYIRRSDRIAIIFLLALILIISAGVYITGRYQSSPTATVDSLRVDSLGTRRPYYGGYYGGRHAGRRSDDYQYATDEQHHELFTFDPNTADSTQLLRLGLAPWQVRNIYRYRARGGVYSRPADFARLYGMTQGQYRRLEPYISIDPAYQSAAALADESSTRQAADSLRYPVKIQPGQTVGINAADTNSLKTVPGIGSGFANAIVSYRQRLGGFYALEQLYDINNFPEQSMDYLTIDSCQLRKVAINRLTLNELKRHPYIGFHRAKAIVDYRRLNGDIHSLSELSLHRDFTPEARRRLEPYIEY